MVSKVVFLLDRLLARGRGPGPFSHRLSFLKACHSDSLSCFILLPGLDPANLCP